MTSTLALAAAPAGLLNKTVTVSFAVSVPARGSDGSTLAAATRQVRKTIYVSSAGRVFSESSRRGGGVSQRVEAGPDATAGAFRFQGNKMIGTVRIGTGASQLIVNFDPGFQSCTAEVLFGGENGRSITWKGLNGVTYTSTGRASVSSPSCSVAGGNAFAR